MSVHYVVVKSGDFWYDPMGVFHSMEAAKAWLASFGPCEFDKEWNGEVLVHTPDPEDFIIIHTVETEEDGQCCTA